jgi:hypothetical protein
MTSIHGSMKDLESPLLVLPESLKCINDSLMKEYTPKMLAQIVIKKKFLQRLDPDEYIEEEQMYSATGDVIYDEAVSATLDISSYPGLNVLLVKNFDVDKVNYNLVAQLLLKEVQVPIVSITPGQTPHDKLICTMGSTWDTDYEELPPPFVVTGITGSLISLSKSLDKHVSGLVLQSEGVPGFEKVNEYSVGEVAQLLKQRFSLYDNFVANCEKSLHYGKSVNNLGLYL